MSFTTCAFNSRRCCTGREIFSLISDTANKLRDQTSGSDAPYRSCCRSVTTWTVSSALRTKPTLCEQSFTWRTYSAGVEVVAAFLVQLLTATAEVTQCCVSTLLLSCHARPLGWQVGPRSCLGVSQLCLGGNLSLVPTRLRGRAPGTSAATNR